MELIAPAGGRTPVNIQGSKTVAEIVQINQDIADGLVTHGPGTPITLSAADGTNGTVYRLKGVGRNAAFAPDGGGNVGTYATTAALQAAKPAAANTGGFALVGSAAPYAIYDSNGVAWQVRGSG